ncbi:TraC family protein [Shewanella aestuarii]|uniref:TraC family protein n=1 Tax=Shewanella aestuarii TaxID=1028752 RepID=A0A6G9QRM4_9GAMM|nr:TraC family protein [Shewanella aestuarii]QIR16451.1 TraC family protein [Shewanella aestuarii]
MGIFSSYFQKLKKLTAYEQTEQLFGFAAYQDGYYLIEGGGMAVVFCCQPTPGCNEELKNTYDAIFNKEYPADTCIQTQLVAIPDISYFSQCYETTRGNRMMGNDNELTTSMAEELINDLEGKVFKDMHNGSRLRDFEYWFTIRIPTAELIPTDKELKRFREIILDIQESLTGVNHHPRMLEPAALLWRLQSLFNSSKDAIWRDMNAKPNASLSFNEQIIEKGNTLHFTPNGVVTGKPKSLDAAGDLEFEADNQTHIKILSLESMPSEIAYGQMYDMIGDWRNGTFAHGDPFMISTLMHYPEQSKAKSDLSSGRKWLLGQAKGKVLEYFQGLAQQKQDYDQMWKEVDENGAQIVNSGTHIIVFSSTELGSDRSIAKMKRYFDSKRITFARESVLTGPLLLQNIPCMMDSGYANFSRHSIYSSEAMVFLTPHMSSWKGNTNLPIVPLVTRSGQVFFWDLFKTDGGFNFLLSAATGSGKSVLMNYIINCYLNSGVKTGGSLKRKSHEKNYEIEEYNDGAQVFLFDSGRSYQNLAEMFEDSQFICFDETFKYSLNPFSTVTNWSGEDAQGPQIATMLKAMAAPKDGLTEVQRAEMMTLLTDMWNELGQKSTITEFVNRCNAHEESYMRDLGKQLKIFAEGGVYGHFFTDTKPSVDYNGRLIVIETEDLETDLHLQLVVILGMITQIQQKIFQGGTSRKSLFLLEEAWQWLTASTEGDKAALVGFVGEFLQSAFRKFRKTRSSGGVITQSLLDCTLNPVGKSILANTDWKIFLGQDPSTVDTIKNTKAFTASDHQFEQMKSVKTVKGSYSEMMIFLRGMSEICRLELEPETLMIFSTDPDDRELMKKYRGLGHGVKEAARLSVLEKRGL